MKLDNATSTQLLTFKFLTPFSISAAATGLIHLLLLL
jgi:hypothetical protein